MPSRQMLLSQEFKKNCKHPGETDSESGADPQNYSFEHVGVMKRAEFCKAAMRGVLDSLLGCRVYDPTDHTRMNRLFDELIAHSVHEPVFTPTGRVFPYRHLAESKGDAWAQRYQVLKTGWSVAMYPSEAVSKLVYEWRSLDSACATEETADQKGGLVESADGQAVEERALDECHDSRQNGCSVATNSQEVFEEIERALKDFKKRGLPTGGRMEEEGPRGYTFRCEIRRGCRKSDYYVFTPARKKLRSLRDVARHLAL